MTRSANLFHGVLLFALASVPVASTRADDAPASCGEVASDRSGSILFYNVVASSATDPGGTNTRLTVMNVGPARSVVRLIVVGRACTAVADIFMSLQPNQARSFLASDLAPDETGYAIAIELDAGGLPSGRNGLIGSESVKIRATSPEITGEPGAAVSAPSLSIASDVFASFGAEAIPFVGSGGAPFERSGTTLTLRFDGLAYGRLPQTLSADHFLGADAASTLVVVNAFGGSLPSAPAQAGLVFLDVWNELEVRFSVPGMAAGCQLATTLAPFGGAPTTPTVAAPSSGALGTPAGWFRVRNQPAGAPVGPILGAIITPRGGSNLRKTGEFPTTTLSFQFKSPCVPRSSLARDRK